MTYYPGDRFRRESPGDNKPEWTRPEIVAAEQRVLMFADALVSWMKHQDWGDTSAAIDGFFTHVLDKNPGCGADDEESVDTEVWVLDKLDRDANQLFFDLLRAAWERRCWQTHYGERETPHDPGDTPSFPSY